jgi:hypothetical protein
MMAERAEEGNLLNAFGERRFTYRDVVEQALEAQSLPEPAHFTSS